MKDLVLTSCADVAPRVEDVTAHAVSVLTSSDSAEWYTPRVYVEAARLVLGAIDLDPASCELANRTVKAARFYTEADDGLRQPWRGRVWLNPPYGRRDGDSNQGLWTERLHAEHFSGRVHAGIALVNASTGAAWFQRCWEGWVCLTDHRIRFVDEAGNPSTSPTKDNAFVYFGPEWARFAQVFSRFGRIIPPLPVRGQGLLL